MGQKGNLAKEGREYLYMGHQAACISTLVSCRWRANRSFPEERSKSHGARSLILLAVLPEVSERALDRAGWRVWVRQDLMGHMLPVDKPPKKLSSNRRDVIFLVFLF